MEGAKTGGLPLRRAEGRSPKRSAAAAAKEAEDETGVREAHRPTEMAPGPREHSDGEAGTRDKGKRALTSDQ